MGIDESILQQYLIDDAEPERLVNFKYGNKELTGYIIAKCNRTEVFHIRTNDNLYVIPWDDTDAFDNLDYGVEKTCQCGLKYAPSGGKHSTWCDLYEQD